MSDGKTQTIRFGRVVAPCSYCWIDDVNAECPEHGWEAVLRADNARLRALVKGVEWEGCTGRDSAQACPWCGAEKITSSGSEPHAATCPAFTSDGSVK